MDEYLGLSDEEQASCSSRPAASAVWTLCEFCEGLIAPDDGCVEC